VAGPELRVPSNLPVQWTSFIGREQALLDVARLLESNHLVTLTGAGGCGKTRLALEVAKRQADSYPDDVWLVELAPLSDPALVGQAVASALGLRPKVRVLATSREALRVPGEVDWRVPSLAVPPANPATEIDDLVDVESVRLFVERGRAVRTDFGVTGHNAVAVAQICRRLDGLPLAIELAATQIKVFPIEQIAAGLDQRFRILTAGSRTALPRHQTLAAMVAWSYDLLTTSAQSLFNRLSVFAGGFTLEAAAVCAEGAGYRMLGSGGGAAPNTQNLAPSTQADVLGLLSELVQKCMVVAEGGTAGIERYHLLETLRQYGRERLIAAGEAEVIQEQHAAYYLQLAEEAKPHQFGPEELSYLARLDREWDNIRTAFRWFIDRGDAEAGLRLAAALELFLWYRGLDQTEGDVWRRQLLSLPVTSGPSAVRANAHLWTALCTIDRNDLTGARRLFADALTTARQAGDERMLAWIMHRTSRYGGPDMETWYGSSERELAERADTLFRSAGDRWGMAINLAWLGYSEFHRGAPEYARKLLAEALATARAVGERHCVAFALRNLGEVISAERDAEAAACLTESLRLYRENGDIQGEAYVELILGRLDYLHARYAAARKHFEVSLRLFNLQTWWGMIAQCLDGLAMVSAGQRRPTQALRLAGASAGLSDMAMQPFYPIERPDLERALAPARDALGEGGAAAAWAEGQAMTLKQAVAYALATHD
jgi:non-specific serine/threonine protein kinase